MLITVFGASGRTGRALLESAAQQGHQTVAHVRDAARLRSQFAHRTVIGEVFDQKILDDAVDGADAAVIALGLNARLFGNSTPAPLYSLGTKMIISALERRHVSRLLVVSEATYNEYVIGRRNRAVCSAFYMFQAGYIRERVAQDQAIRESELDWTIMRPTVLTEGSLHAGSIRTSFSPLDSFLPKTSRRSLSELILDNLENSETYGKDLYF